MGRSVAAIAGDLGVSDETIYEWRREMLIDTGQAAGLATDEVAELVAVKRRIRQLETELAVTRRANERLKAKVVDPKGGSRRSQRSPPKASRFGRLAQYWMCRNPPVASGSPVHYRCGRSAVCGSPT